MTPSSTFDRQNNLYKALILFISVIMLTGVLTAQQHSSWRGTERNGIYHDEGLLREWPEDGPEIIWSFEGIGEGYSSPAFANGEIYISGMIERTGYIFVFDKDGVLKRKFKYGPEFYQSYPGSRSTPLIVEDLLYTVTGKGRILCMDAGTGLIKWSRDAVQDFNSENIRWGITENLLINGDKVFFSPGGTKHNIVALDRFSGETIWSSPGAGKGDLSAYCSPILIELPERNVLVTIMATDIVGVDAETGQFLWSHPQTNRHNIHANSPVFKDGSVLASSEKAGSVKLSLKDDGIIKNVEWTNAEPDPLQGGVVIVDGYAYTAGSTNRGWFCMDWQSGETIWSSTELDRGVVLYADNRLYIYTEKGVLALVRPTPEKLDIVNKTIIKTGTGEHFSYPVIHEGRLYVRRGNAIVVFNISL